MDKTTNALVGLAICLAWLGILRVLYWTIKAQNRSLHWMWWGIHPIFGLIGLLVLLKQPGPAQALLMRSYTVSLVGGFVFGAGLIAWGAWLYQGTTNGEFSASVGLIPGPLFGALVIGLGIVFIVAGAAGGLRQR